MFLKKEMSLMSRYSKEQLSLIVRVNIRKYRKMRGYTMQELADKTGLTHGYVRDLECLTIDKTPLLETIGKRLFSFFLSFFTLSIIARASIMYTGGIT